MKLYICDQNKMTMYNLPVKSSDDFVVYYNTLDSKSNALITLNLNNNSWFLKNDENVSCLNCQDEKVKLELYRCYRLKIINSKNLITIFVVPLNDTLYKLSICGLDKITIGQSKTNIISFNNPFLAEEQAEIRLMDGNWMCLGLEDKMFPMYVNKERKKKVKLKIGDIINVFNLKIVWMENFIFINNPLNQVIVSRLKLIEDNNKKDKLIDTTEEEKNVELYSADDYFYHVPRLRGKIKEETFVIDPPPVSEQRESLPFILTIGSSVVMMSSTFMMGYNVIYNATSGTNIARLIPQIVMMLAMLFGSLMIPLISKRYQKRKSIQREKLRISKYSKYLEDKEKELELIIKRNSKILKDSYLSYEECENVIRLKNNDLWCREITDDDFLVLRLGLGRIKSTLQIDAPKEHFTLDEDQLLQKVYEIEKKNRYLENVPITVNIKDNPVISILFNCSDVEKYMDGLFLQLIALHSPNELNIVIFTDGEQINNWNFFKNLPHCWSDDKKIRYFASNIDNAKNVSNSLSEILKDRKEKLDDDNNKDLELTPYYLIITDNYKKYQNIPIIQELIKNEENLGVSLVCMDSMMQNVPANSTYFIEINDENGNIVNRKEGLNSKVEFICEPAIDLNMDYLVQRLANIPIRSKEADSTLPNVLPFLDMFNVSKIEQLNILNRWSKNNPVISLDTPVGVHADGELFMLNLHEKAHGPHGLVAGMTGSGKSEFIITYILSMAINFHPYEVQFVLIDYKGGGLAGAFENRETNVSLPHLAGTITNLDVSEMNRTLVSIQSELKRRQRIFNEVRDKLNESTIDIYKYQKLYREGVISEPMSHLFIISDEFAELKQQQPEFMQQLISTSRIGRSLGVHLILATQKPSGVVNDQIWSNSKFKVCLKVQNRSDSQEMLKKPDAASIKETGRFYLQVGYDDYFEMGQSAWSGAKYYPSDRIITKMDYSINFIDETGYVIKKSNSEKNLNQQKASGEQLTNLVRYICELGKRENIVSTKLWLDAIPPIVNINLLKQKYNYKPQPYLIAPTIGEYDEPENQRQGIVNLDLTNVGNTAIFGIVGSGKEDLVKTIIWSSIVEHTPQEVNIYILDYGSGSLKIFKDMPHVGDIVTQDELSKTQDFFQMINDEMENRKDLLSDYAGSYTEYLTSSGNKLPLIEVIINSYESFCESNMRLQEQVQYIYRESPRYGIIFVLTSVGINGIRGRMLQNFNNKICLQLPNESDYRNVINTRKKVVAARFPGRGIIEYKDDVFEFQTASFSDKKNMNNMIKDVSKKLYVAYNGYKAHPIPTIPNIVIYSKIYSNIKSFDNLPLGYDMYSKKILYYNLLEKRIFSILTSDMTDERMSFIMSVIKEFTLFSSVKITVVDLVQAVDENINKVELVNKDFDDFVVKMNNDIINNFQYNILNIYIFLGIGDLKNNLSEDGFKLFEHIMGLGDKLKKTNFVFADTYFSYKSISVEPWYIEISKSIQGIWLGENIVSQKALYIKSLDSNDRNLSMPYLGYFVKDGKYNVIKHMVDYVEENDEK